MPVALRKLRLETVPVAAERMLIFALVAVAVVKLPNVAKRLVVVTEVPVAVVKSTLRSEVEPTTTKVPVTEELAATNPPKNWAVVVVNEPRAVTDCRVSRPEEAGQLVPSVKQTETKVRPPKPLVPMTVEEAPSANGRTKFSMLAVFGASKLTMPPPMDSKRNCG